MKSNVNANALLTTEHNIKNLLGYTMFLTPELVDKFQNVVIKYVNYNHKS